MHNGPPVCLFVYFFDTLLIPCRFVQGDGDVAQLVEHRIGTPPTQVRFTRCGKGFFSQSQLAVQTLLRCPYTPRTQLHALTSVRTLKIP